MTMAVAIRSASGRAKTEPLLEVLVRPHLAERFFVVCAMVVYGLGLPTDWFTVPFSGDLGEGAQANASTGPLASLVFAGVAGVAFMIALPRIELIIDVSRRNLPLLSFVCWSLLSFLWSADPSTTLRRGTALLLTVFVGFYCVLRFTQAQLLRLAAIAASIGLVINLAWVVLLPQYGLQTGEEGGSWSGVFVNKNSLGQFATLSLVVLVMEVLNRRSSALWAAPLLVVGAIELYSSQSKTSLAAAFLLGGLLIVFTTFRSRKTLFGAVAVSLGTASVAGFLFGIAALPFITRLLDKDITLTGRTQLWSDIIDQLGRRPILGYGYEAYWNGWDSPAAEIWRRNTWTPPTAHNAPLDYILQLGVVGLALFLVFLVTSVVRSTRMVRDVSGWAAITPLMLVSFMLMFSVTESGVVDRTLAFLLITAFTSGTFLRPASPLPEHHLSVPTSETRTA